MSDQKMLPCPFCGSDNPYISETGYNGQWQIECCGGRCFGRQVDFSKDKVIAAWNRRPEVVATDENTTQTAIVEVRKVVVAEIPDASVVYLRVANQQFAVGDYLDTAEEIEAFAEMLRTALRRAGARVM